MDDRETECYITEQIKERGVTLYDILGGPSVDPEPQNHDKPYAERVRSNRFSSQYWDLRLSSPLSRRNPGSFTGPKTEKRGCL